MGGTSLAGVPRWGPTHTGASLMIANAKHRKVTAGACLRRGEGGLAVEWSPATSNCTVSGPVVHLQVQTCLHLRKGWGWGDNARQGSRQGQPRASNMGAPRGPTPHTESLLREEAVASAYLHY
jgi:hypothetical protein